MAISTQSYRSHMRLRPAFHYFVVPVVIANMFMALWRLIQAPSFATTWAFVLAAAIMMIAFLSRTQALTVQDRLIRLEMRLRLKQLLPPDLQPRIAELTTRQLVSMRFASDAELPDLMREVLAGNLVTPKAIKMRVKEWQADWLRV